MELSLSKLLPAVPKHSLETDGGDSSDSDNDVYDVDDSSLGRDAKKLFQSVRRQCLQDFQKETKDTIHRIQSNVHKFSMGKRKCIFVWQNGATKNQRCERDRSGKHGKYCSAEHKRQVERRGKKRTKKVVNILPPGPTIYLDNQGNAHPQPQATPDEDELLARLNRLGRVTLPELAPKPTLPAPTLAPTLPAPVPTEDDELITRFARLGGSKLLVTPNPTNIVSATVDNIEEIDIDDLDYSKLVTPENAGADSAGAPDVIPMEIDEDEFIAECEKALKSLKAPPK
jgi:hypothetical protein